MKKYKYMHTMEGRPAHYYPGKQICFAVRTRPIPLVDSIDQIKRERKASHKWRISQGFDNSFRMGWMKVQC